MKLLPTTFLALVAEKHAETIESFGAVSSIEEALGRMQIELHRLISELALPEPEQNSENLLESLVALALASTRAAEDIVLPELKGDAS